MKSMFTIVPSRAQSDIIEQRLQHNREGDAFTIEFLVKQDGIQRFANVLVHALEEYMDVENEPRRILMKGTLMNSRNEGKKVVVVYTPMEYIGDGSGFIILTESSE